MDPQQQQQMAGMMASFGIAFVLIWLLMVIFFVFLFWRIFTKAGMAGALGLIALLPGLGWIICLCILAFSQWRVTPVTTGYAVGTVPYPPAYPPQSYPAQSYPPASYPPAGPPTQL